MHYIVMDLEWNQGANLEQIDESLPFEIIEIGAVKLNQKLEQESVFHRYIKPKQYLEFSPVVEKMLPYNEELLQDKDIFPNVMKEFLKWCGKNYLFCTYGDSDLLQLQRNMDYYGMKKFEKPLMFYDIQRLYRFWMGDLAVSSLEHVSEILGIKVYKSFHQAFHDAEYAAEVFKRISREYWVLSIDVYNNPKNKKEEIYRKNRKGILYITREFVDKRKAMEDSKVRRLQCVHCDRNISEKIAWFSNSSTVYYAVGTCPEHGYIRGKIKVKNTPEGQVFLIKTMKAIDKDTAESIKLRQQELRLKRRVRKKRTQIKK